MVESNQAGTGGAPSDGREAMTVGNDLPTTVEQTAGQPIAGQPTSAQPWYTPGATVDAPATPTAFQPPVPPPPIGPPTSVAGGGYGTGTPQPATSGGGKGFTVAIIGLSVLVVAMAIAVIIVAVTRGGSDSVSATGDEIQSVRPPTTRLIDNDTDADPTSTRPSPPMTSPPATAPTTTPAPPPPAPVEPAHDITRDNAGPIGGTGGGPGASGMTEAAARARIDEQVTADRFVARESVQNRWVAQLSSKKVGTQWQGRTWGPIEIWEEFAELDARYGTLLLDSAEWGFQRDDLWVTVTRESFTSGEDANRWCDMNGYPPDDCFAKLLHEGAHFSGDTLPRK